MKKNITRIVLFVICLVLVVSAIPTSVYASGKKVKKMTVYNQLVKSGNTVAVNICEREVEEDSIVTQQIALATVNLKTGKVKILAKNPSKYDVSSMKLKGNYLYYLRDYFGHNSLYRTNIKTGKSKRLAEYVTKYAISGKKIYFRSYKDDFEKGKTYYYNKVMKLNGKNKKKTSITTKKAIKKKNVSEYKLIKILDHTEEVYEPDYDETYTYNYYRYYLQKPDGKKVFIIMAKNDF